jgi:hypothetical protein
MMVKEIRIHMFVLPHRVILEEKREKREKEVGRARRT